MDNFSLLQKARMVAEPSIPKILSKIRFLKAFKEKKDPDESSELKEIFPHTFGQTNIQFEESNSEHLSNPLKVGVVLSGGQAPGGHNVIAGLFDALKMLNPQSLLFGFLKGPGGIIKNQAIAIDLELLKSYRNQGGFDLLGSGRTKIETLEQLQHSLNTVKMMDLDGLVVVGGDDSNTNAAILAEYFVKNGCKTKVIGVPKTIDGDLKNEQIEISFGFDTASKIYSEIIGNLLIDCASSKKYTHFVKIMGRSASNLALECALKTHPNCTLIGEEIFQERKTLNDIVNQIADLISRRGEIGKHYGVILIPEGLIEFIPQIKKLIEQINSLLVKESMHLGSLFEIEKKISHIARNLSNEERETFLSLPNAIQAQFILDRDPHGNVQLAHIDTQQLLIDLVTIELKKRNSHADFHPISHYLGYEGRSGLPSNFDSNYCYALGQVAALLINFGFTGYMSTIQNLKEAVEHWKIAGISITSMMRMEMRGDKLKPVIQKALVDLEGGSFQQFIKHREGWALEDHYCCPGPIQFYGDKELTESIPMSLVLN